LDAKFRPTTQTFVRDGLKQAKTARKRPTGDVLKPPSGRVEHNRSAGVRLHRTAGGQALAGRRWASDRGPTPTCRSGAQRRDLQNPKAEAWPQDREAETLQLCRLELLQPVIALTGVHRTRCYLWPCAASPRCFGGDEIDDETKALPESAPPSGC
jgi:hypothetical protein